MYTEIETLFAEIQQLHDLYAGVVQHYCTIESLCQEALSTLSVQLDSLAIGFRGGLADPFFNRRDAVVTTSNTGITNLSSYRLQLSSWTDSLKQTHDSYRSSILNTMGNIPAPVWNALTRYVYFPGVREIHQDGPGYRGNIIGVWDEWVSSDYSAGPDEITALRMAQHHVVNALQQIADDLQAQGWDIGYVRSIIANVDQLLFDLKQQLHDHTNQSLRDAAKLPDICHHHLLNLADLGPMTLTQAQAKVRADDIIIQMIQMGAPIDRLQSFNAIKKDLAGLSPADQQAVLKYYQQDVGAKAGNEYGIGQDFYADLNFQLRDEPDLRYQITSLLAPQNVQSQAMLNQIPQGSTHILGNPMLTTVPAGTYPGYQYWDANLQQVITVDPSQIFVVNDAYPKMPISGKTFVGTGFPGPGTYTVYIEIPPAKPGDPPIIRTFKQSVGDPTAIAQQTLDQFPTDPAKLSPQAYLDSLTISLAGDPNQVKMIQSATSELQKPGCQYYPIPATYVSNSTYPDGQPLPSTVLPLTLYARHNQNGSWDIIDVTNPQAIQTYHGDTLAEAWKSDNPINNSSFIKTNNLPDGVLVAKAPLGLNNAASIGWNNQWKSENNDRPLTKRVSDFLGMLSTGLMVLGFIATVFIAPEAVPFLAPALFMASGALGATAGVMTISDQVQSGQWKWDVDHVLEIGGVGLNAFVATGEGSKLILQGMEAAAGASGTTDAVKTTLQFKVTQSVHIGSQYVVQGSTIVISGTMTVEDVAKIKAILAQGGDASTTLNELLGTLGDASMNLMQVGIGVTAFLPDRFGNQLTKTMGSDADQKLNDISDGKMSSTDIAAFAKNANLSVDELEAIAKSPQLQSVYDKVGPDAFKQWVNDYSGAIADGNPPLGVDGKPLTFTQFIAGDQVTLDGVAGAPTVTRYQNAMLDTLKNHLDSLQRPQNMSAADFASFKQLVASDTEMQMAVIDHGFDTVEAQYASRPAGQSLDDFYHALGTTSDPHAIPPANDTTPPPPPADMPPVTGIKPVSIDLDTLAPTDCGKQAIIQDFKSRGLTPPADLSSGLMSLGDVGQLTTDGGATWLQPSSQAGMERMLLASGDGATAIVFLKEPDTTVGHFVNATVVRDPNGDLRVDYTDTQTGKPVDFHTGQQYGVLITQQGAALDHLDSPTQLQQLFAADEGSAAYQDTSHVGGAKVQPTPRFQSWLNNLSSKYGIDLSKHFNVDTDTKPPSEFDLIRSNIKMPLTNQAAMADSTIPGTKALFTAPNTTLPQGKLNGRIDPTNIPSVGNAPSIYGVMRGGDSEAKILTYYQQILQSLPEGSRTGTINLYTYKEPCDSCQQAIEKFLDEFPGVKINLVYSTT